MKRIIQMLIIVVNGIILPASLSGQDMHLEKGTTYYVEVTDDNGVTHQFLFTPNNDFDIPGSSDESRVPAKKKASSLNNGPIETASKSKARIISIMNELMTYQSEESLRKYGRLFPGMDGKLYGTSDSELRELLSAFLMMKEPMLVESKGELISLYKELELYASNQLN